MISSRTKIERRETEREETVRRRKVQGDWINTPAVGGMEYVMQNKDMEELSEIKEDTIKDNCVQQQRYPRYSRIQSNDINSTVSFQPKKQFQIKRISPHISEAPAIDHPLTFNLEFNVTGNYRHTEIIIIVDKYIV